MDLHKIIQDALYEFIQSYIPNADLSTLDDVILSYMTGVLEDLGSQDSVEENFDVEVFVEMLEAYIPGFAEIDSVKVCEMMFNLSSKLATARNADSGQPKMGPQSTLKDTAASASFSRQPQDFTTPPEGATAQDGDGEGLGREQHLLEMFPKCSVTEARSALSIAKGDLGEAVRLIIEGDLQLREAPPLNVNHGKPISPRADEKLKASILEKYMLVDDEEDKKVHRPVTPKDAPKKLVRYHGNQVVTTKGERYHQVKKDETDEVKKTYISLKPARKYRFH
ncbi:CUE domain-containing protein 2 [Conger conger]|uniref:CUE domain-containing protein 2 n=1 Tax=Conger conger TaxID=82655 RepID=UPI002A5ACC38|nr:CUE domain-containing protein 2 [Conger conger]